MWIFMNCIFWKTAVFEMIHLLHDRLLQLITDFQNPWIIVIKDICLKVIDHPNMKIQS